MSVDRRPMISFGPFRLDTGNQRLCRGSEEMQLTPKASAILEYLVKRPNELVTHNELLDVVWHGVHVQPEVLKVYIAELRRSLGDSADKPSYIKTVHRRGYKFIRNLDESDETAQQRDKAPLLVGRGDEFALLDRALGRAAGGERQIIFITGDAGIGKTALLNAFMQRFGKRPEVCAATGLVAQAKSGNRTVFTHPGCGRKYPRDTEGSSASIGVPGVCAILAGSIPDAH